MSEVGVKMAKKNYVFEDFEDLKNKHPRIAKKLVEEVGLGDWVYHRLYILKNRTEYAKWELTEGMYANYYIGLQNESDYFYSSPNRFDKNNGELNPFNFVNYEVFGTSLLENTSERRLCVVGSYIVVSRFGF